MVPYHDKIIRPTDPRVRVAFPKPVYKELKQMAENNIRRISDEIVVRLIETLSYARLTIPIARMEAADGNQSNHTRVVVQFPAGLFQKLTSLCEFHEIDFANDVVARIKFSLWHNEALMASDRLRRLIFCKRLSYEYQKIFYQKRSRSSGK